MILYRS